MNTAPPNNGTEQNTMLLVCLVVALFLKCDTAADISQHFRNCTNTTADEHALLKIRKTDFFLHCIGINKCVKSTVKTNQSIASKKFF